MKIRILACGRSGTMFTSKVFQTLGYDVLHEQTGMNGTVSCCAYGGDPFPRTEWDGNNTHNGEGLDKIEWTARLHQVRHPLLTIESAYIVLPAAIWNWCARYIPIYKRMPKLYRCMVYWLKWNELCERESQFTYQVEQMEEKWNEITAICGITDQFPNEISKNTNHERRNQIPFVDKKFKATWEMLNDVDPILTNSIIKKAKQYGYEI